MSDRSSLSGLVHQPPGEHRPQRRTPRAAHRPPRSPTTGSTAGRLVPAGNRARPRKRVTKAYWPDEPDRRGDDQQDPTGGLGAKDRCDTPGFRPGTSGQESRAGPGGAHQRGSSCTAGTRWQGHRTRPDRVRTATAAARPRKPAPHPTVEPAGTVIEDPRVGLDESGQTPAPTDHPHGCSGPTPRSF